MSQSKSRSLFESIINTLSGYIISIIVWHVVAKIMGIPVRVGQSIQIVTIFTIISITRNYIIRRLFNAKENKRSADS